MCTQHVSRLGSLLSSLEDHARGNTYEFDELCSCRIKSADLLSKARNK